MIQACYEINSWLTQRMKLYQSEKALIKKLEPIKMPKEKIRSLLF